MKLYLIGRVAKSVGIRAHKIAYAIDSEFLPEPSRIGNKRIFSPEQVEEIHVYIRTLLSQIYDNETGDLVRIQYGGSIKPSNAEELFSKENIDGGLVGGASLQADSLTQIINAAEKSFK